VIYQTGYYGPQIWDTRPLELLGLQKHLASSPLVTTHAPWILSLGLNDVFMIFAGFSLALNVLGSYANVRKARVAARKPILPPLSGLIPFVLNTVLMVSWLLAKPEENILRSHRFVPFVGIWGFGFAYQVRCSSTFSAPKVIKQRN
jgi:ethanolaminephosphotransferase